MGVPIQDEGLQVIAMGDLMLPAVGPKGRPDHIDLVLLCGHQEIGIDIAAVEQMGAREQVPSGQILDDGRSHRTIGRGRRGWALVPFDDRPSRAILLDVTAV